MLQVPLGSRACKVQSLQGHENSESPLPLVTRKIHEDYRRFIIVYETSGHSMTHPDSHGHLIEKYANISVSSGWTQLPTAFAQSPFSHKHMRNLLGKQWPVKLWNMALFQCETEPLQAWNFSASLIFITTWLVRWKSRLCPPRCNSWVRHVEDSSHDAVIFHSSVCGCQTLQMSILCLLRMQGSPNIFFDIVVGIGIHKEQGGILLWLVAR